ncbi:hypothetical protein D9M71_675290 [compost metagenome]
MEQLGNGNSIAEPYVQNSHRKVGAAVAAIRLFVVEAGLAVMLRILGTEKRGSFRQNPDNLRVGVQNCLYIVNIVNHLCCTPDRK